MGLGRSCGGVAVVALALLASPAGAAVLEVCASCAFVTIEEALDDAADGDRILVHPGQYIESLTIEGLNVEIVSVAGPSATVLEGLPNLTTLTLAPAADVVVSGFHLKTQGPRVIEAQDSRLTLRDVELPFVGTGISGPVLHAQDSDLVIERARLYGGDGVDGGCIQAVDSVLQVVDSRFDSCFATGQGGAIDARNTKLDVTGTVIRFSRGLAEGGAISGGNAELRVLDSRFESNESTNGGDIAWRSAQGPFLAGVEDSYFLQSLAEIAGGALLVDGSPLAVRRSGFHLTGANSTGAAIQVVDTEVRIHDSEFEATMMASVIQVENSAGPVEIRRSHFFDSHGTAAFVSGPATLVVEASGLARGGYTGNAQLFVGEGHLDLSESVICEPSIPALQVLGYTDGETVIAHSAVDQPVIYDPAVEVVIVPESSSDVRLHDNLFMTGGLPGAGDHAVQMALAPGNPLAYHNNIVYARDMQGPLVRAYTSEGDASHNLFWSENHPSAAMFEGANLTVGPGNTFVDPLLNYVAGTRCEAQDYGISTFSPGRGAGATGFDPHIGPNTIDTPLDDMDEDGFLGVYDCDDRDPLRHPEATEVCNGVDDDCDGAIDARDPELGEQVTVYADLDRDGYGDAGDAGSPTIGCVDSTFFDLATVAGDCDDAHSQVSPAANEVPYDGVDNDCSGGDLTDVDGDGVDGGNGPDCDDTNPSVFPAATEVCNGIDDDCDGNVDGGAVDAVDYHVDSDGDGYGDPNQWVTGCAGAPGGFVADNTDCNDDNAGINPNAAEVPYDGVDNDCDGSDLCDVDDDGFDAADCEGSLGPVDCDDTDPAVNPNATEVPYDGIDNDCVGGDLCDVDGDGSEAESCGGTDCDDADASVFPGAVEACNGIDDDCDGSTDPSDAVDATTWYTDSDGDGFGHGAVTACTQPAGTAAADGDCDDDDASVRPGAAEQCNGVDDDCDTLIDDDVVFTDWYADADGDGFGDGESTLDDCVQPAGHVADDTDCDDGEAAINPDATEVCNGVDDDCSGEVDDGLEVTEWYIDADGDGFGDPGTGVVACQQPDGTIGVGGDCDDASAAAHPDAMEVPDDGIDNDCSGGPTVSTLTSAALCGCRSGADSAPWWMLLGLPLLMRRRHVE